MSRALTKNDAVEKAKAGAWSWFRYLVACYFVLFLSLGAVNLWSDTAFKAGQKNDADIARALKAAPFDRFIELQDYGQLRNTPMGGISPDYSMTVNVKEVPEGGLDLYLYPAMSCDFKPFDGIVQPREYVKLRTVQKRYNQPRDNQWVNIPPVLDDGGPARYPEAEANCYLDLHGDVIIDGALPKGFEVRGNVAKVRFW